YTGSAQLLPDGRVLLVPKFGNADFQVYDPKSDAWSTPFSRKVPPCITCTIGSPSPPEFLAAPLGNGKVFLLTVDPQRAIAAKTEVIDLQTGTATLVTSPGKIGQSRLELLPDGRIWVTALQARQTQDDQACGHVLPLHRAAWGRTAAHRERIGRGWNTQQRRPRDTSRDLRSRGT